MTEQEFKDTYVKSFLEAYKTAVGFKFWFSKTPTQEQLLENAKEHADQSWQEYLKDSK